MTRWIIPLPLAWLLLISCKSKQEKIKPVEEKITESVYASGIVKSKNQYQAFSVVNGLVAEVFVNEGDLVKTGDPLIRLSSVTAELNRENAKLSADYSMVSANVEKLNDLKNNIDLARTIMETDASLLERQRNLWQQQIGTRNELDQRELTYKSSVNAFEAAKLRYAELQKQINFQEKQSQKNLQISKTAATDYTIRSETNGKVYSVLKEKGEMVNTQSPVALVGDATSFILELQADEYDIAKVKVGQKIILGMDSYKGQVFKAVVEKINPYMNERSKSFTIEAGFINQPPALFPNLTCEANIVIQEKEKALTIPRNCLLEGDYVLLASKEKRKVTIGLKDYQKVEILSGLTINDIILNPAL
ncbi:MAG: efflux RND transporter periplasmic adaptor subunit [Chitinophagaceae bacterium]